MDADSIFWGLMFGAIGSGYFVYGKNSSKPIPMIAGVGLCTFTYFVTGTLVTVLVGGALTALPFFLGRE